MSNEVWISEAFTLSSITKRFAIMFRENIGEYTDEEWEVARTLAERSYRGEPLSPAEVPKAFCGWHGDTRFDKLPDFFNANGFLIVSERCANIFRQFDLGLGGLAPVELFQGNRKTRMTDEPFYFLNFGCSKTAFLRDQSNPKHFKSGNPDAVVWRASGVEDGDCVLTSVALEVPDLWMDSRVKWAFFLSGRLVSALRAAKVSRNIPLRKCQIVE